nr:FecR domain-containing protein [Microvirga makkahensis]
MSRISLLVALLLSVSPVLASDWTIAKVSGDAWVKAPNAPAMRAVRGMTLPDGATFSTGHNARAKLERGAEAIMVNPNSTISSRHSSFFGTTSIRQPKGRAEYEVEERNVRHFSVETPFLAAIVKGTRFTVSVSARSADVQVDRGLVEVSDLRTGSTADIAAGQRAKLNPSDQKGLQITGRSRKDEVMSHHGAPRRSRADTERTGRRDGSAKGNADDKGSQSSDGKGGGRSGGDKGGGDQGGGDQGGNTGGGKSDNGTGGGNAGGAGKGNAGGNGAGGKGGNSGGKGGNGNGSGNSGNGGNGGHGRGGRH